MFYFRNEIILLFVLSFHIIDDSYGYHMVDSYYMTSNRTRRQVPPCKSSQFPCTSGSKCIARYLTCDGAVDCDDGSDETAECRKLDCPEYAFRCAYGACVDGDAECNGEENCADSSDENTARCPKNTVVTTCGKRKFTCQNEQCIDIYNLCDGKKDCVDGSDETFESCSALRCPSYAYQCAYGGCVDGDAKCDDKIDCADGSDENPRLCGRPTSVTETPLTTTVRPGVAGCMLPEQPRYGKYNISGGVNLSPGTVVFSGTYLTYRCNIDYGLLPNIQILICAENKWSNTFPSCVQTCSPRVSETVDIECEYDGNKADCTKRMYDGTIATMKCKYHYQPADITYHNKLIRCQDGSWDFGILRCVPACGNLIPKGAQTFVVGGTDAAIGDFPWHVGIYKKKIRVITDEKTQIEHICGGSIINPKVIISAAHCFADQTTGAKDNPENYLVAAGKYFRDYADSRDKDAQKRDVKNIILSKNYRGLQSSYTHDIALVVLSDILTISNLVQPVCLDWSNDFEEEQLRENGYGMVAGWGLTQEGARLGADSLKELKVPYIEKDKCFQLAPPDFVTFITPDKICAGWTNGSSVCQGDSGGGLVFMKQDVKKYFIRGLVSNGPVKENSCDSHQIGLYTQVSQHLDLIRRTESDNRPT